MSEQAAGNFGGKNYRNLASGNLACAKPRCGPGGGGSADALGAVEQSGIAAIVVPVAALHVFALACNHHAAEAVSGAGITANKAQAVAVDGATAIGIQTGAVTHADTRIGGKGGFFTLQCQLDGLLRTDIPRVPEIQIGQLCCHLFRLAQTRTIIRAGVLGNGQCSGHGFANGVGTGHAGAGVALALAGIKTDGKTLVAGKLHRLHFTLTHTNA